MIIREVCSEKHSTCRLVWYCYSTSSFRVLVCRFRQAPFFMLKKDIVISPIGLSDDVTKFFFIFLAFKKCNKKTKQITFIYTTRISSWTEISTQWLKRHNTCGRQMFLFLFFFTMQKISFYFPCLLLHPLKKCVNCYSLTFWFEKLIYVYFLSFH